MKTSFSLLVLAIALSQTVSADEGLHLASAQVAGIQTRLDSGNTSSVLVRYAPYYSFGTNWSAGLNLGWSPQVQSNDQNFSAFEILAQGGYAIDENWGARAAIGTQYWTCAGCKEFVFSAGAGISRDLELGWAPFIKNAFFDYLVADQTKAAHQFILGLSIELN